MTIFLAAIFIGARFSLGEFRGISLLFRFRAVRVLLLVRHQDYSAAMRRQRRSLHLY